jgi:hypothetical protein
MGLLWNWRPVLWSLLSVGTLLSISLNDNHDFFHNVNDDHRHRNRSNGHFAI